MKLLGIDNVFFEVEDLEIASSFYQSLGFIVKMKIPQLPGILYKIGEEEPGLILTETTSPIRSKLWLEVEDAHLVKQECEKGHISGTLIDTATGITFQVSDPWNNIIGFADYSKKPELARKNSNQKF